MLVGAGYLPLAALGGAALAEFVTSVAKTDRPRGKKAQRRLPAIDRKVLKFLDEVAVDNERLLAESKALVVHCEKAPRLLQMALQGEKSKVRRRTLQKALLHSEKPGREH